MRGPCETSPLLLPRVHAASINATSTPIPLRRPASGQLMSCWPAWEQAVRSHCQPGPTTRQKKKSCRHLLPTRPRYRQGHRSAADADREQTPRVTSRIIPRALGTHRKPALPLARDLARNPMGPMDCRRLLNGLAQSCMTLRASGRSATACERQGTAIGSKSPRRPIGGGASGPNRRSPSSMLGYEG